MLEADPLLKWRDEFPILQTSNYLINNSLGAMPRAVYGNLRAYADMWATRGVRAWSEGWWDMNVEIGNQIGEIIGAPDSTISIHQNIAIAQGVLLSCFDYEGPRNKVVVENGIFPSDYYNLRGMLPSHVQIEMVESHDNGITVPVDEIVEAIDDQTLLVLISHVLFRSAYIVNLDPIIEKAHRVGAIMIVDGFHAGGIIPVDVSALNVDFYLGGVLKWMCGGPGGIFLYARPDYLKTITPRLTGWMAHKRPFAFEPEIDFREDAFRLLNGTPAIPSLYAIQPGIEIIAQVGVETIREKSLRMTAHMIQRADAAGWEVNSPRESEERGGTVTVNPPHAYEVSRELLARNIVIDYRIGAGIRVSPHFYNTFEEIDACFDAIADILSTGAWEQHAQNREFIT